MVYSNVARFALPCYFLTRFRPRHFVTCGKIIFQGPPPPPGGPGASGIKQYFFRYSMGPGPSKKTAKPKKNTLKIIKLQ
jgi:hypothetical protein